MSWTITYSGSTVTLPYNPTKAVLKQPAYWSELDIPGDAILMSYGTKLIQLQIDGTLWVSGDDIDDMYTDYIDILQGWLHQKVALGSTGRTRYNGNWVLAEVNAEDRSGIPTVLFYKMLFVQSATEANMIII